MLLSCAGAKEGKASRYTAAATWTHRQLPHREQLGRVGAGKSAGLAQYVRGAHSQEQAAMRTSMHKEAAPVLAGHDRAPLPAGAAII